MQESYSGSGKSMDSLCPAHIRGLGRALRRHALCFQQDTTMPPRLWVLNQPSTLCAHHLPHTPASLRIIKRLGRSQNPPSLSWTQAAPSQGWPGAAEHLPTRNRSTQTLQVRRQHPDCTARSALGIPLQTGSSTPDVASRGGTLRRPAPPQRSLKTWCWAAVRA